MKIPTRPAAAGAILHTQLTTQSSVDALLLTLSSPPSHRAPEGPTTLSEKDFIHISASLFTLCLPLLRNIPQGLHTYTHAHTDTRTPHPVCLSTPCSPEGLCQFPYGVRQQIVQIAQLTWDRHTTLFQSHTRQTRGSLHAWACAHDTAHPQLYLFQYQEHECVSVFS